jgi:2-polyprenyl-3-methyl-5-hydroxy-6-metoxy-1,4-benzoquinol methylase
MDLSRRSYQKELLDRDDIPFVDIKRNMQELNFINTYLGGHAITLDGLRELLSNFSVSAETDLLICEIGCGGGDNLKTIAAWCKKENIHASFIGIDINADCIGVAIETCKGLSTEFVHSNYKEVDFHKKPEIIFSSLFCHHFSNEELVDMLQWMRKNSLAGFFINDLHRHSIAYFSIKWLSRIFSKSYLIKNDAPLSVARGFTRTEWLTLLNSAKITNFKIQWKWAFRWLIIAVNNHESASLHIKSQYIAD